MGDAKWCGHDSRGNPTLKKGSDGSLVLLDDVPTVSERYEDFRHGKPTIVDHLGFGQPPADLRQRILVPKYYDPELKASLDKLRVTHELPTVGDLIDDGLLDIATGIEVGKMAYGTGTIPFIRTSDISNWELKADPKHGVSDELYAALGPKLDVRAGDILMVRDGTYLIGTCAMVMPADVRMLYQSHIFKIRVLDSARLDPYLFFAALNAPIVKKQIRSKQFTQDIIDTLGARVAEVRVPLPKSPDHRASLAERTRLILDQRAVLREEARRVANEVGGIGVEVLDEEDRLTL